jgi:lysophospholipase L1-like esterase
MKNRYLAVLAASACISLGSFTLDAQPIRILPYGDSVTSFGSAPESSYRFWLFVDLTNAGFQFNQNFVLVGTSSGAQDGPPANNWPAEQYSGGEGQTSANAASDSAGIANSTHPDVVLLDFGANDVINNFAGGDTETNLETSIQAFAAENPNVVIFLAVPTGFEPDPTATPQVRQQQRSGQAKLGRIINNVAKVERAAGVRVIVVNLFGGFSWRSDTKDGSHPNVKGEQMIARRFFNAIKRSRILG